MTKVELIDVISDCLKGSEKAQITMVRELTPYVRTIVSKNLRNEEEIAEACHRTFIRLFEILPRLKSRSAFTSFLGSIAKFVAREEYKKRSRREEREIAIEDVIDTSMLGTLDTCTTARSFVDVDLIYSTLACEIEALPSGRSKAILELRFLKWYNPVEISDTLDVSQDNVRSVLRRFRLKLKKHALIAEIYQQHCSFRTSQRSCTQDGKSTHTAQ